MRFLIWKRAQQLSTAPRWTLTLVDRTFSTIHPRKERSWLLLEVSPTSRSRTAFEWTASALDQVCEIHSPQHNHSLTHHQFGPRLFLLLWTLLRRSSLADPPWVVRVSLARLQHVSYSWLARIAALFLASLCTLMAGWLWTAEAWERDERYTWFLSQVDGKPNLAALTADKPSVAMYCPIDHCQSVFLDCFRLYSPRYFQMKLVARLTSLWRNLDLITRLVNREIFLSFTPQVTLVKC